MFRRTTFAPRRTTSAPRRAALATAGAAALALALPTTASAEPPATDHFKGTFVHVEQEVGGCLDVPFPVEHVGFFNVTVKEQVRQGAVYVSLSGINLSTYTNLDTGVSLRGHATFHDVDRKVVDNGDGTITVTFRSMRQERRRRMIGPSPPEALGRAPMPAGLIGRRVRPAGCSWSSPAAWRST